MVEHGLYVVTVSELNDVEDWIGEQIDVITTTYTSGGWDTWRITFGDDDADLQSTFGDTDRRLILHTPAEDGATSDYSDAVNGDYDSQWADFADDLIDLDMEDTVFRMEAEFNKSWSPRMPDDEEEYADALARFQSVTMDRPGADFDYLFSPSGDWPGSDINMVDAWPPNSSFYDTDYPDWGCTVGSPYDAAVAHGDGTCDETDPEGAWQENKDEIDSWSDFLDHPDVDHGYIAGTVEWGLADKEWNDYAGCDNPLWTENMTDAAEDEGWAFLAYWNAESSAGGTHRIFPTGDSPFPDAGEMWRTQTATYIAADDDPDPPDNGDDDDDDEPDDDDDEDVDHLSDIWDGSTEQWDVVVHDGGVGSQSAEVTPNSGVIWCRNVRLPNGRRTPERGDFVKIVMQFSPDTTDMDHVFCFAAQNPDDFAENGIWSDPSNTYAVGLRFHRSDNNLALYEMDGGDWGEDGADGQADFATVDNDAFANEIVELHIDFGHGSANDIEVTLYGPGGATSATVGFESTAYDDGAFAMWAPDWTSGREWYVHHIEINNDDADPIL